MQACKTCTRADRLEIDQALIAGTPSLRTLARQYATTASALHRHRPHIAQSLVKAKNSAEVAQATTLLARVKELIAKAERIAEKASQANEFAAAARGLAEVRQCLELLGELSGELQRGDSVNVALVAAADRSREEQWIIDEHRKRESMSLEEILQKRAELQAVIDRARERNLLTEAHDGTEQPN